MKCYRLRWDHPSGLAEHKIYSVVAYDLPSAERRVTCLTDQHRTGIEIVRVKPGTDEVLEIVWPAPVATKPSAPSGAVPVITPAAVPGTTTP